MRLTLDNDEEQNHGKNNNGICKQNVYTRQVVEELTQKLAEKSWKRKPSLLRTWWPLHATMGNTGNISQLRWTSFCQKHGTTMNEFYVSISYRLSQFWEKGAIVEGFLIH